MGAYDIFGDIQLKAGACVMGEYTEGDLVSLNDGVYVGLNGVVVILNGKLAKTFPTLNDKDGGSYDLEEISYNPVKDMVDKIEEEKMAHLIVKAIDSKDSKVSCRVIMEKVLELKFGEKNDIKEMCNRLEEETKTHPIFLIISKIMNKLGCKKSIRSILDHELEELREILIDGSVEVDMLVDTTIKDGSFSLGSHQLLYIAAYRGISDRFLHGIKLELERRDMRRA